MTKELAGLAKSLLGSPVVHDLAVALPDLLSTAEAEVSADDFQNLLGDTSQLQQAEFLQHDSASIGLSHPPHSANASRNPKAPYRLVTRQALLVCLLHRSSRTVICFNFLGI